MNTKLLTAWMMASTLTCLSCDTKNNTSSPPPSKTVEEPKYTKVSPDFNEQLAYNQVQNQVNMGPRVPGTPVQVKAAKWFEDEFKKLTPHVQVQKTTVIAGDKSSLPCYNIFAQFNPEAPHRILLLAHWDTRPWADMDFKDRDSPIDGADDGASGVGVLLEIARVLNAHPLKDSLGVDILLVDVEDYGKSEWGSDSYALGSQYFSKNPIIKGYTANAGILLDMVGGKGAVFPLEGFSYQYARPVLMDVWNLGQKLGYGNYFVFQQSQAITDDHLPINKNLKIPTIDIINLPQGSQTGFVGHWHTHNDKIENIDPATLKAVGQTVLEYIYTR